MTFKYGATCLTLFPFKFDFVADKESSLAAGCSSHKGQKSQELSCYCLNFSDRQQGLDRKLGVLQHIKLYSLTISL